jgi:predicted RNA-binding Zn-ribbon protein involved in translation (DUF1610 family)
MTLPKAETFERGTWRKWIDRDFARKADVSTACVTCPNCGNAMSLREHRIAENGAVSPSVVCPTESCTFHEFVTLEEWSNTNE